MLVHHRCAVIFTIFCALAAIPQQLHTNEPIPTLADQLRRHNVPLEKDALIDALKSQYPDVRWLAAQKLAEDGAKDALPQLRIALTSETDATAREDIAFALAQLGDDHGLDILRSVAVDSSEKAWIRLTAAKYILDLAQGDATLKETLLDFIRERASDQGWGIRSYIVTQASNLLARSKDRLTPTQRHSILSALVTDLADDHPAMRTAASRALVLTQDESAIPYLRQALANEKDPGARPLIEADLHALSQKYKSTSNSPR